MKESSNAASISPASANPVPGGHFSSLQAGRAVAALLVVLMHCSVSIFALPKYWGTKPFGPVFDFGHAGVEFFFVLSGFIILHVHWQDLGIPARLGDFAYKRFRRIYPIYWVVLALVAAAYFANPAFGKGHEREPLTLLSSFLLVHLTPGDPVLPVSWTLFHEILFYVLFGLVIFRYRLGMVVAAAFLVGAVARLALGHLPYPLEFLCSPYNLLFAMGALAAWLCRRDRMPAPALLVFLGVALFGCTALDEVRLGLLGEDARTLLYGLGSAQALAGAVELERGGRLRVWAWLRLLGDASYAIYLAHFPTQSLMAKVFVATGLREALTPQASFVLLVLLSVAVGLGLHLFVERPLLALLSRRPDAASAAPTGAGAQ